MTSPCGDPACPVAPPDPDVLRHVRGVTWPAGTVLRRGHKASRAADELTPTLGDTRFAPLDDTAHAYVATRPVPALLESVLHDVNVTAPRIRLVAVRLWAETEVTLTADVRLADLTDSELARLEIRRDQLVTASPRHYACTRQWAAALQGRTVGGHQISGIVWDSRLHELHAVAVADRPALQSLMQASDARVAVLWSPPLTPPVLAASSSGIGPLAAPDGDAFLTDLAALLGIVITR